MPLLVNDNRIAYEGRKLLLRENGLETVRSDTNMIDGNGILLDTVQNLYFVRFIDSRYSSLGFISWDFLSYKR